MRGKSLLARSVSLSFGVLFVLSFACFTAFGQAGTSTVHGTVTDQQGNVVSGATVKLINVGTTATRTTTTADVGVYTFDFVPPGDYRVEVTATGFKKAIVNTVHAVISQPTPVDVKLEVGNVAETVTVSANQIDPSLGNNSTSMVTTVLGVPALTVTRIGNSLRLSWPASSGFKLQANDALNPVNWADVGTAPQVDNGQNVLTVGIPGSARFYRLRSP